MGIRSVIARAASSTLTWGLRNIAHRQAGNFPGKTAMIINPKMIVELRGKLKDGSIVVVGTNGKTTVNNLLANVLEEAGLSIICNRSGANLNDGIATALLQGKPSEWGVFECDELWLARVLPDLQSTYVLLLNLFRDQLDRCGEIDRIQDSIVDALVASPGTTLIYNADDPLCAVIARRVAEARGTGSGIGGLVAFGITQDMNLAQNLVADATICQFCSHMLRYDYRQYGQLGSYVCDNCGFARPVLDYTASEIDFDAHGLSMTVNKESDGSHFRIQAGLSGSYMAYNMLAVYAAANMIGCTNEQIQAAITAFDPKNGRLQEYSIRGRRTLLNLAKNPTGFNQNLRIAAKDEQPHAVAFFINDKMVDGFDISWIWDIDFEELASQAAVVFAGGIRKNDLQVRLKYAGIDAKLVDDVSDVYDALDDMSAQGKIPRDAAVYAIANYTALPPVHDRLNEMAAADNASLAASRPSAQSPESDGLPNGNGSNAGSDNASKASPIVIAHILPDLLNLYGDGGNVRILEKRLEWRGTPVEIRRINYGDTVNLDEVDLVFMGGAPDREQKMASEQLLAMRDDLASYVSEGGPLLAICGGFQILGRKWLLGGEEVPGLSILDIETRRPGTSADRLVDNIALKSPLAKNPVIGYENHAGRTYLDDGMKPFGEVVSKTGKGNNDDGGHGAKHVEGVLQGNVLGTYLHGPLLSKNPEVADWLLARAAERHATRTGAEPVAFTPLDDSQEKAANAYMAKRLV